MSAYTELLFAKYGTLALTEEQTAEVVNRGKHSLTRDRQSGKGISFVRQGDKPNSPVRYPIDEIAKYLEDNKVVRTGGTL